MKLATLHDGSRDGALVIVSRDLERAVRVPGGPATLIEALERWSNCAASLESAYSDLNAGRSPGAFALDPSGLAAPLPRAPQWLDASAYHSHGDLMEKVFGLEPPPDKLTIPLMYQGASDDFLGPQADMPLPSEADGIDFEAEVGVIVDYVPMSTPPSRALEHVKLLVLINDASLRAFAGREVRTGFGFLQAKPATSFAPVAVTPDELGPAWREGRIHGRVRVHWNAEQFGEPDAGAMGFGFHELIAHAARTRNLHPGTIIGSGTISNPDFRSVGSACIAERRGIETLDRGEPVTGFMRFGDRVRIEMLDDSGRSIFGAIDQRIVQAARP